MALVCWSGGCDSTLVLYQLAAKSSKDTPIHTISITHPQIPAADEQMRAREALLARFKEMGFNIQHTEVVVQQKGDFFVRDTGGIFQAPTWLSIATPYLLEDQDLYMGYVREDDLWHYRYWAFQIFDSFKTFLHLKGELKFPLEWMYKIEVVRKLRSLGLLDLCWWCEVMDGKARIVPCGRCQPCTRHRNVLTQIEREDQEKPKSEAVTEVPPP